MYIDSIWNWVGPASWGRLLKNTGVHFLRLFLSICLTLSTKRQITTLSKPRFFLFCLGSLAFKITIIRSAPFLFYSIYHLPPYINPRAYPIAKWSTIWVWSFWYSLHCWNEMKWNIILSNSMITFWFRVDHPLQPHQCSIQATRIYFM